MSAERDADRVFASLLAAGRPELPAEGEPPTVVANMIQTIDGHIARDGRSETLGDDVDTGVLMRLRALSDAVLVGSGTLLAEGYGRPLPDQDARRARQDEGRTPEPLVCVVSRRLELAPSTALFQDPAAHVIVLTAASGELPDVPATVSYLRSGAGGFDLRTLLTRLRAEHGVDLVVVEGGPTLNARLVADDLLDELWLALHPLLAGPSGEGRLFGEEGVGAPSELVLRAVATAGDFVWTRYARA